MGIKSTFKLALNFFIDNIMGLIPAVMLMIPLSTMAENKTVLVLYSAFCGAVTLGLIYSTAWKQGNKDLNMVNYKHMKKNMLRGLISMAIALAPGFLFYCLSIPLFLDKTDERFYIGVFKFINMQWGGFIILLEGLSASLTCLVLIFPLAVATASYIAGYKDIVVFEKLIYKKDKSPKK